MGGEGRGVSGLRSLTPVKQINNQQKLTPPHPSSLRYGELLGLEGIHFSRGEKDDEDHLGEGGKRQ